MTTNPLPSEAVERVAIQYERASGATLEAMRENARTSPLYQRGDMILVWVNEADLDPLSFPDAASEREKALEAALWEARGDTHLVAMLNPSHQADNRLTGNRIREAADRLARIDALLAAIRNLKDRA